MDSWIFYFTDSLGTRTAVVGAGDSMGEAEVDALAKWGTAMSGRDDYGTRSPIVSSIYSEITTELDGDMPGLVL